MSVLTGPCKDQVNQIYPDILYGKIIFNILKQRADLIAMINVITKEQITFKELFEQSIKAAIGLKKLGVRKNDAIGIVSENCLQYFVPVLASLYIGAFVHPVNPAYTTSELKYVFDISKPKVIFASELSTKSIIKIKDIVDYINIIIAFKTGIHNAIGLEELFMLGNDKINEFTTCDIDTKENNAFLLCSAETTGLPKCVMLTHANMRTASSYIVDNAGFACSKSDITIGLLPFYHIFGILINLGALLTEMKIILLPKFKPILYLSTIEEYKITKLIIAPPLAVLLSKSSLVNNYNLTSITDIICGAAPLGSETEVMLKSRLNVKIRQAYGLTEIIGAVTVFPFGHLNKPGSIGKLVYGSYLKISDLQTSATLGPNEVGEICIIGATVMKGYLLNEEATQSMFDSEGFLHTGDIGYFDKDEFIYIIDRLKELIKYKGFQVSPSEIENLLISHKDICDAVVIGIPDERAGELAFAFVVRNIGSLIKKQEIVDYIAENISIDKQLHGGISFIDAIPKSAAGKILRKQLHKLVKKYLLLI